MGMWSYGFNSSGGPFAFDSYNAADELDIIELGYNVMFATACENDEGPEFGESIINMRATRATVIRCKNCGISFDNKFDSIIHNCSRI